MQVLISDEERQMIEQSLFRITNYESRITMPLFGRRRPGPFQLIFELSAAP